MAQQVAPSAEVIRTLLSRTEQTFHALPTQTQNEMNGLFKMLVNSTYEEQIAQAKTEISDADEALRRYYAAEFETLLRTLETSAELSLLNEELDAIAIETKALHIQMRDATESETAELKARFLAAVARVQELRPRLLDINRRAEHSIKDLIRVMAGSRP